MNFTRGNSPKQTLDVGMVKQIPILMKDTSYDYKDYEDVLDWAVENYNINVFKYIVALDGQKWFDKPIKMCNQFHYQLWECSSYGFNDFIDVILNNGQGFMDEELRLDAHHLRIPNKESRSGFYIHHTVADYISQAAKLKNSDLVNTLMKHYTKYK